jgi:hypothetical protein
MSRKLFPEIFMVDVDEYIYQSRYIAFLDILGFTEHVYSSKSDAGQIGAIAKVLEIIEQEKEHNDLLAGAHLVFNEDNGFYMFSDSVILTAPTSDPGLIEIFLNVSSLIRRLLGYAVLLRGAIVQGDIYEKKQVIFGPGLIEAYKIESTSARYPRILVSEDVRLKSQSVSYEVRGRKSMPLSIKIRRDFDGLHHLDWMLHYHTIYGPETRGVRINGPEDYRYLKERIEFALKDASDSPAIKSKVYWLANYFNDVITRGAAEGLLGRSRDVEKIAF